MAPFFRVPVAGALVASSSNADSYCFKAVTTTCPANSIPVRNSNTAGDNSATIIGCIIVPSATNNDLGSNACPATLPTPTAGTFTFFVAAGVAGTNPTVTAGNIVECRKNDANRSCGSLLPVRSYDNAAPAGCISLAGALTECLSSGFTSTAGYTFELYGPTIASGTNADATPRLEACITNPQPGASAAAQRSCALVVPASTYTVTISSDPMNNPGNGVGSNQIGCARVNTACPKDSVTTKTYPLIGPDAKISSCRASSACATTYITLCDATGTVLPTTGVCAATETLGCYLPPASSNINQCSSLGSSTSKYPVALPTTASSFKFVVSIDNQNLFTFKSCTSFASAATTCNPANGSPFVNKAYPAGE